MNEVAFSATIHSKGGLDNSVHDCAARAAMDAAGCVLFFRLAGLVYPIVLGFRPKQHIKRSDQDLRWLVLDPLTGYASKCEMHLRDGQYRVCRGGR